MPTGPRACSAVDPCPWLATTGVDPPDDVLGWPFLARWLAQPRALAPFRLNNVSGVRKEFPGSKLLIRLSSTFLLMVSDSLLAPSTLSVPFQGRSFGSFGSAMASQSTVR